MPDSRPGLTLDTGVLIAIERRERDVLSLIERAQHHSTLITLPAVVLTEWWRGQRGLSAKLREAFNVEALTGRLALLAGEALAHVPGPSIADAIVMASAAQRGDLVLTANFEDLDKLRRYFRGVRLRQI